MIQLGYLTSCARGIQARDDEPILVDVDKGNLRIQAVFASATVTSFTSTITDIIGSIANVWYQDQDVMEVTTINIWQLDYSYKCEIQENIYVMIKMTRFYQHN